MIILASGSPRRKELLSLMGLEFEIITSDVDETPSKELPSDIVMELSKRKCDDVYDMVCRDGKINPNEDNLIIAADTLVFYEGVRLGKPADAEEARQMIRMLSGNKHEVITGVTLIATQNGEKKEVSFYERTEVNVYPMTEEEIDEYVASGEPLDKAGSYAIQGLFSKYIKGIEGDYSNVVGLPVSRLYHEMKALL